MSPFSSAAASARAAASCNSAGSGSGPASNISNDVQSVSVVNCAPSARPACGSSGASFAIATARSAMVRSVSGFASDADTIAWRCPINTRRPTSIPSDRSACSSAPARTSIEIEVPSTAIASAVSAPACRAKSSICCVRSERELVMGRPLISLSGSPPWPRLQVYLMR